MVRLAVSGPVQRAISFRIQKEHGDVGEQILAALVRGERIGHRRYSTWSGQPPVDVIAGGFPCQDVSINGKMQGADGARTTLYKAMIEAVRRTNPTVFVAENVKGLLMEHSKDFYEEIIFNFKGLGYDVSAKLYLAADYGVPQMRERVFIVGTKGNAKKFKPTEPTLKPDKRITSRQALDVLMDAPENPATNHIWSRAKKSSEQGSRKLKADKPGDTMRAECHGNIQFHY